MMPIEHPHPVYGGGAPSWGRRGKQLSPQRQMRRKNKTARKYAKQMRKDIPAAEVILWQYLRRKLMRGYAFRRQHPVGSYITDFACLKANLIVELDGDTHSEDDEVKYDERRTSYLQSQGWTVIRFWNGDIYDGLPDVLDTINRHLPERE